MRARYYCIAAVVLFATAPVRGADVPTELWQVAPDDGGQVWGGRAATGAKGRAVVLVPGLTLHPLRPARATVATRRPWQEPTSALVKALAPEGDVFAFGYAQTASVDDIATGPGLRDAVARLRKAGYKEIVLVGHSAGGVIARLFAEQNAGATKVVAVAAPFAGAEAAALNVGYGKVQAPFVRSLAPDARRVAPPAAAEVPLVCVVCRLKLLASDGVVAARSQWPDDLQRAGAPAVLAPVNHFDVMDHAPTARIIAELTREKLARWDRAETERARKVLFEK